MNSYTKLFYSTLIVFSFLWVPKVNAQALTPNDILAAWDLMTEMVLESAKLMPAEGYSFTPNDELRNFANQINHTAASNVGFGASVNAGIPEFEIPDRSNPPQKKEEVISFLENSFKYYRCGLESLTQDDLESTVPWGRLGNQTQISRLKAILIVMSHLQREHGKTMMYLRAQGITPPPSGSFSF
ncbi:MAG: DinB family protein [Balneolaceae bacterium]|nr:DinB family protein [Balneolaceae bacterium]MBO6546356.1 DinB family protein [Balneolaceae bacterium]MBO6648715.1 DinB family protein [Balneolaceae bacterium]